MRQEGDDQKIFREALSNIGKYVAIQEDFDFRKLDSSVKLEILLEQFIWSQKCSGCRI